VQSRLICSYFGIDGSAIIRKKVLWYQLWDWKPWQHFDWMLRSSWWRLEHLARLPARLAARGSNLKVGIKELAFPFMQPTEKRPLWTLSHDLYLPTWNATYCLFHYWNEWTNFMLMNVPYTFCMQLSNTYLQWKWWCQFSVQQLKMLQSSRGTLLQPQVSWNHTSAGGMCICLM